MKKYRILSLTDHQKHSDQNSLYAILSRLCQDSRCESLDVASRAIPENKAFFSTLESSQLLAKKVESDFAFDPSGKIFSENTRQVDLLDYDLILMRLPRPISDRFLMRLNDLTKDKVVINNPLGIINTSTKAFLLNFPSLCPTMQLCKNMEDILEASQKYNIVLKPLKEYGGKGILKISGNQLDNGQEILETRSYLESIKTSIETDHYLAMKFMKNVTEGDKRLLVVGGKILAASLRMPAKNSWLCNVAQGGTSLASQPTAEEINIVQTINPSLEQNGILIYGLDTLMDDSGIRILSEVNTLSIGGFPQAEKQTGKPIINNLIDNIFSFTESKYA